MSLLEAQLPEGRQWLRVGDAYEVTKKPRGLDVAVLTAVPFAAMENIPRGGEYTPDYVLKAPGEIRSGTYFERGDILVAKITPSFENGKQALTTELPTPYAFATTEVIPLRPRKEAHDRRLLFFYLLHPDIRHHIAERMEGTTGRQRVPQEVLLDLPFPDFEPEEQTVVADSLEMIQKATAVEARSIQAGANLKRAALRTLFTRGLRGEERKVTDIGPMPESWESGRLGDYADVLSTPMAYSELEKRDQVRGGDLVRVLGIKVADMNLLGNEVELKTAALETTLDRAIAVKRCAPPHTIIFPKRGAAIATNKKRISTTWTTFDPNVIGIIAGDSSRSEFSVSVVPDV